MSKTPEELAAEYCEKTKVGLLDRLVVSLEEIRIGAFLSGYQAGRSNSEAVQAAVPQWISVKDRLPPKDTIVLFYRPTVFTAVMYGFWDNDRWYEAGDVAAILPNEVTHWMPLPKPPEE